MKTTNDTWFSGWTVAVVLALLLVSMGFNFMSEVSNLETRLDKQSAGTLVESLQNHHMFAEGRISGPLLSLAGAGDRGVATAADVDGLRQDLTRLDKSHQSTGRTVAVLQDSTRWQTSENRSRLSLHEERIETLRRDFAVAETVQASTVGRLTRVEGLKEDVAGLVAKAAALTKAVSDLGEVDRAVKGDVQALGASITDAIQAFSARLGTTEQAWETKHGALQAALEKSDKAAAKAAEDLAAERKARAAAESKLEELVAALEAERKTRSALETTVGHQRTLIESVATRLGELEVKVASQTSPRGTFLAYQGNFDGNVVPLGQLTADPAVPLVLRVTVRPKTPGKLSLVIGSGETAQNLPLTEFGAEAVERTVEVPAGSALSLAGEGTAEIRLTIAKKADS